VGPEIFVIHVTQIKVTPLTNGSSKSTNLVTNFPSIQENYCMLFRFWTEEGKINIETLHSTIRICKIHHFDYPRVTQKFDLKISLTCRRSRIHVIENNKFCKFILFCIQIQFFITDAWMLMKKILTEFENGIFDMEKWKFTTYKIKTWYSGKIHYAFVRS
jgi:hypothetical protein